MITKHNNVKMCILKNIKYVQKYKIVHLPARLCNDTFAPESDGRSKFGAAQSLE